MSSPQSEAFCRLHGRTFDATREPGCPTCRGVREKPPAELPWGKIAAGLIALFLGWAVLGGDRSADAETPPSGPRMKVHLYRAQIQTLEGILYAEGTQGESDLSSLVTETQRLAALMKDSESRLSVTPLILEVTGYADFLVRIGGAGFDAAGVDAARSVWERIRARVFEEDGSPSDS